MKVKDLIAQLHKLDPNLEVCCIEDGPVPLHNDYPGPFEITEVSAQRVALSRQENGRVSISFDPEAPGARNWALVGITSDL